MKSTGKIVLGMAAVFAAGAIAGLLFAPAKGKKTRKRILNKGMDFYNTINDTIEDGKESLEDMRGRLKDKLAEVNTKIEHLAKAKSN